MIIAKMVFKLGGIHHQNQILRSHFRKLHQCQRYQCYQCQCCSLSAGDLVICSSIDINDECNKCNKHAEVMHRSCMSKSFLHFFGWHLNWYIIYLRFNTECLASYIYLSLHVMMAPGSCWLVPWRVVLSLYWAFTVTLFVRGHSQDVLYWVLMKHLSSWWWWCYIL